MKYQQAASEVWSISDAACASLPYQPDDVIAFRKRNDGIGEPRLRVKFLDLTPRQRCVILDDHLNRALQNRAALTGSDRCPLESSTHSSRDILRMTNSNGLS
ncbi:MAG: hypothetical protein ACREDP_05755, partial [Bradyrhizobium sp.]